MTDRRPTDEQHAIPPYRDDERANFPWARAVWMIATLAVLGYAAFGSVSARIWRFNRLYFEDRRVSDVWRYEGKNLPDVPAQDALTLLYYGSVVVLVVGVILGLWFLLDETGFRESPGHSSPEHRSPDHA